MSKKSPEHIVVSRNDAVGDVILALPVCGLIKKHYPGAKVSILGRSYTREVALSSRFVDGFINEDDWQGLGKREIADKLRDENIDAIVFLRPEKRLASIAKTARIAIRIGTANRVYHWFSCNKLIPLSRKNSPLHEAQLNSKLLAGLRIQEDLSLNDIPQYYGLERLSPLLADYEKLLSPNKFNLILHPKSHGNSLEWGLHNFETLVSMLDRERFNIFITGSTKERSALAEWISKQGDKVTDITGMFSLTQFIAFINRCNGLVAASTGPVHIAAALGIHTLGLYSDIRTKEGHRWGPVGEQAEYLQCTNADMDNISPRAVADRIESWL